VEKELFAFLFCALFIRVYAQPVKPAAYGADSVISFSPGKGQNAGQTSEYFPLNVLGLPDTNATWDVPSSDPAQICCLGLGGTITLGFMKHPIIDKPGADFSVFENAFLMYRNKIFCEPARVEISRDNIHYYQYDYDTLYLSGCAGLTPTNGKNNPSDPSVSGGDHFDIGILGLDTVRYVRITDICNLILKNKKHPSYSLALSGFDLDAVVAVHHADTKGANSAVCPETARYRLAVRNYPNPFNPVTTINYKIPEGISGLVSLKIYDILGKVVASPVSKKQGPGNYNVMLDASNLSCGIYIARLSVSAYSGYVKLNLIK